MEVFFFYVASFLRTLISIIRGRLRFPGDELFGSSVPALSDSEDTHSALFEVAPSVEMMKQLFA